MDKAHEHNDDFLEFESKVTNVMKLLEDVNNGNKQGDKIRPSKKTWQTNVLQQNDVKNFIVTLKNERTIFNQSVTKDSESKQRERNGNALDTFTFMQQLEEDIEERAKARRERERIGHHFRSLGNGAFRKQSYEKAITMYTKAIDYIKDSPILYNNRALAYIKLKNYKRCIMDCDFVINKLEEKDLRSWLYRAAAYKRLGDENNFQTSIKLARKNNPKKCDIINDFIEKVKTESF